MSSWAFSGDNDFAAQLCPGWGWAECRSKGGKHDARRSGRAIWAWRFAGKPAQILRHSQQQQLRQQQRLRLARTTERRKAPRGFAMSQCEHDGDRRGHLATCRGDALAVEHRCFLRREGGNGLSADDGELAWLMHAHQMLTQERAVHARSRARDSGLEACPRVDSRVLHSVGGSAASAGGGRGSGSTG